VRRVEALNDRWEKLHQVIAERARSEEMQGVPGGSTGLVVKTVKAVGKGEDFRLVEQYEVDVGLLKAILEHERQAAAEAGGLRSIEDSRPQVHVNVTNVRMTLDELKRLPPEELRRRHREALRLPLPEAKPG
jgi:flagellar motor switch/type III secretory pathway protein FliN